MSPHKDAEVGCDESPCVLACCSPVGTDIEVPPCLEVEPGQVCILNHATVVVEILDLAGAWSWQ